MLLRIRARAMYGPRSLVARCDDDVDAVANRGQHYGEANCGHRDADRIAADKLIRFAGPDMSRARSPEGAQADREQRWQAGSCQQADDDDFPYRLQVDPRTHSFITSQLSDDCYPTTVRSRWRQRPAPTERLNLSTLSSRLPG